MSLDTAVLVIQFLLGIHVLLRFTEKFIDGFFAVAGITISD